MRKWQQASLFLLTLVLGLWLGWPRKAAASTVTLTGTVTDAQQNPINGTLIMRLAVPAINTSNHTFVPNTPVTFQLVNGSVSGGAPLLDNTNMSPYGNYYIADFYGSAGNHISTQFYSIPSGATFDLGQAVPTTITTSNISYVNPVALNAGNIFTAIQQFNLGILTDAVTGITPGGTLTIAGANGMASPGEDLVFNGGDGTLNEDGGSFFMTGGSGNGTGAAGSFNLTAGAPGGVNGNGGNVLISGSSGAGTGVNGSISLNPCSGACSGSGGGGNIVLNTSIWQQGTGFKHVRFTGGACTTGAGVGDTCTTMVNWAGSAFANTNYTVVCTGDGIGAGVPSNGGITAKAAGSVTFQTVAVTAAAAQYNSIDCMAAHD